MSSSFVTGLNKVLSETEPRITVLCGDEVALQQQLLEKVIARDMVVVDYLGCPSDAQFDCYFAAQRQSCSRVVIIEKAQEADSWDWLSDWLEKTKKIKLILVTDSVRLATKLETTLKSRTLIVDCSSPTGAVARGKIVKYLTGRYNQSITQINLLLDKNKWHLTECIQLLDKLALLNLPLTSETTSRLGIAKPVYREFLAAMQRRDTSAAMVLVPRLRPEQHLEAVVELSAWLDEFTRVKFASGYMKPVSEVSGQTGVDRKTVESLEPLLRKYDETTLNKAAITLASTERALHRSFSDGALELMVNNW